MQIPEGDLYLGRLTVNLRRKDINYLKSTSNMQ